ncbi:MAG: MFS transporter [Acidobacteria bacterium]|nr:MFS transporter [Acidobacteriota bacterium]
MTSVIHGEELFADENVERSSRLTAGRANKKLSHEFWLFFTAAFFFDLGFAVYFFLFNLYLLDYGFNERTMGLVGSALTVGSIVGTIPAGIMAKRAGLWQMLVICFCAAPIAGILRVLFMAQTSQLALAVLAGIAMCLWGVCFSPAVARLTNEENRAFAFSLIFSVSIGSSAIGGLVCGYLPSWLHSWGMSASPLHIKQAILLSASACAALGMVALYRLRIPLTAKAATSSGEKSKHRWNPFLVRFLPVMALWSAVAASFVPFANVYFVRTFQMPLAKLGWIFSAAQVAQLLAGIAAPQLYQRIGRIHGIVVTQAVAALAFGLLAISASSASAVSIYLLLSASQWMSSPGLYSLLMDSVPDDLRSSASSLTMFFNSVMQAATIMLVGASLVHFGYPNVLMALMVAACTGAAMFKWFVTPLSATSVS